MLTSLTAEMIFLPCLLLVSVIVKGAFWSGFIFSQLFPLRKFPGPRWAAYSRLWLSRVLASGRSAEQFVEINKEYGETVCKLVGSTT